MAVFPPSACPSPQKFPTFLCGATTAFVQWGPPSSAPWSLVRTIRTASQSHLFITTQDPRIASLVTGRPFWHANQNRVIRYGGWLSTLLSPFTAKEPSRTPPSRSPLSSTATDGRSKGFQRPFFLFTSVLLRPRNAWFRVRCIWSPSLISMISLHMRYCVLLPPRPITTRHRAPRPANADARDICACRA